MSCRRPVTATALHGTGRAVLPHDSSAATGMKNTGTQAARSNRRLVLAPLSLAGMHDRHGRQPLVIKILQGKSVAWVGRVRQATPTGTCFRAQRYARDEGTGSARHPR